MKITHIVQDQSNGVKKILIRMAAGKNFEITDVGGKLHIKKLNKKSIMLTPGPDKTFIIK